ncbi:hypothetical protein yc1106_00083 [Curvularia clavata]|uniref:CHAT domain-containing protein n=1 Tax=Curvularia clavata TaxID=95742 RepID=A0A9Q8YZF4_CURCL|nr:hypothetical protein yc1106_00083 [Curvularia clavata]
MEFRTQNLDVPPDTIPFNEGLLGHFPLLGRFPDGFLDHRAECEHALIQARAHPNNAALVRALLDLGGICMLQGELVAAVYYLSEAAERAKNRFPTLRALALSYTVHCRTMQYTWAPNGSSMISEELSKIFDYLKRIPPMLQDITETKRYAGYDPRYNWIDAIITFQQKMVSARPVTPTSENLALSTQVGLPEVEAMISNLHAMGIGGDLFVGMLIELAWTYRITGNRSKFESSLHVAQEKTQNHSALAAHVEMRLGDDHCTSYGTPETWDTVLERGTESNAQARDEETLHFMGGGKGNITLAKRHYEKAQDIFQTLGILRGIAGIQLRLGYIATLGTSHNHLPGDPYRNALEYIAFAEDLYRSCGDYIGTQIACAHRCLCRIGIGQEPEDTKLARSIGVWGRENGSYSFAFGLGLFFAKYARRWLVALGDYERAVATHRLAEALFDGLDATLPRLFSITDQMTVYESLGERDRFVVIAERALDICAEVLKSQEGPTADKVSNHRVQILSRMFLQAQKHADPDEIFRAATRLKEARVFIEGDGKSGTASSSGDLIAEYLGMAMKSLQEIIREDAEQPCASSQAPDVEELLKKMNSLDINPLEFQTKCTTTMIDHMSSLAEFLVPFYRGRRASREGDQKTAETLWEVARASLEENPNEQKDVLLTSLYTDMKMYDKALAHTKAYLAKCLAEHQALPEGKTREDRVLMNRGLWQSKNQVLGMFTRTRHFKEADSFLKEIQHEWGRDWWKVYEERVWENLSLAGQINVGLQNYETACNYYEQAMQAFEERRDQLSIDDYKIALAGDSNVQEIYFGATLSAIKWHFSLERTGTAEVLSPQLQRAFENLERGKARSLLDLIGGNALLAKSSAPQSHNQWSEYKQQTALLTTRRALLASAYSSENRSDPLYIAQLKEDVATREQQLWDIAKSLSESGQPRSAPVTATKVFNLPEICSSLTEDTAILQYSYQRNDLIAWMITVRGMTEVYHIEVPEAELERNVHAYHRACGRLMSDVGHYASWLGKTLLPFRSLREHTRLIIVAYRTLHLVPFHSLPWEQELLISTHSVSYLPSASLLKYLGKWKKLKPSFSVLAVGDPSNMVYKDPFKGIKECMRSLPSSALEASQIAKTVPRSTALVSNAATSEAVYSQMNNHSVLHFGTHGSLFAKIPMLSAIHLAGGTQITVDQLMGRELKAELVVLSACNTGRGRITDGEDVVGFARALLAAGVKHVVVSLWPVDDDATCYLMEQFYKNLMQRMSVAEALRAACTALQDVKKEELEAYLRERVHPEVKRIIVRDCSQPKFWAPFILIGA